MADEKYNGWTNYETWCVNLWLNNDEGSYEHLRDLAQNDQADPYDKGNMLKNFIDELNPLAEEASMFTDLLNGALSEVNWVEIVKAAQED